MAVIKYEYGKGGRLVYAQHTIVDVQDKKTLALAQRIYDVHVELPRMFLDFPTIALVIDICGCFCRI